MNWKALRTYQCPKCAEVLRMDPVTLTHNCTNNCDFKISDGRLMEILKGGSRPSRPARYNDEVENNLTDLSNL